MVGYTEIGNSVTLSRIIGPRITFYHSIFLLNFLKLCSRWSSDAFKRGKKWVWETQRQISWETLTPPRLGAQVTQTCQLSYNLLQFPTWYVSRKPSSSPFEFRKGKTISGNKRWDQRERVRGPEFPPLSRDIIFNVDSDFKHFQTNCTTKNTPAENTC